MGIPTAILGAWVAIPFNTSERLQWVWTAVLRLDPSGRPGCAGSGRSRIQDHTAGVDPQPTFAPVGRARPMPCTRCGPEVL
jgi:hypothetical protein